MSHLRRKHKFKTNFHFDEENSLELKHFQSSKKPFKIKKPQVYNEFSKINKLKEQILIYANYSNVNKFWTFIGYLEENQKDSKELLSKSLCDIANQIKQSDIKLKLLEKANNHYSNWITLTCYATELANQGNLDKASELFEKSLSIDPEETVTLNSYASALANQGNLDKASALFDKSLSINAEDTVTLNSYAAVLANQGNLDKACELFDKSLSIDHEETVTLTSYATALANQGNLDKACELFEKSLSIDPEETVTLTSYATALANQGNLDKACELFEKSLSIDPEDSVTLNSYATVLANQGNLDKACELFEKSLSIDPEDSVTLNSYATALANRGNLDKACELFEKSLSIDPEETITLNNYARALANQGNLEKAIPLFEQSLAINPKNTVTLIVFSQQLKNHKQYEKAIQILNQALQQEELLDNDYKSFLYINLGEMYFANSQKTLAEKAFNQAIELSKNKDKTLIQSALATFKTNPYSEEGIKKLLQVSSTAQVAKQATQLLQVASSEKFFYKYFNQGKSKNIQTLQQLERAIYHKVENQIMILRSLFDSAIFKENNPKIKEKLTEIQQYVINIFKKIKVQKTQNNTTKINSQSFDAVVIHIAEVAHNVADTINNALFVIDSKLRYFKGAEHDLTYLLNQKNITVRTINSFKDIQQGSISPSYVCFSLSQLLSNFHNDMIIEQAKLNFTVQDGEFYSDRQRISECLNELLENSLRHNANNTIQIKIDIKLVNDPVITTEQCKGKYLFIHYQDNGKGIPQDKKQWIFNPLNSTLKQGSGLGLFIIRRIIKKLHGRIYENGEAGASFNIFIPQQDKIK